MQKEDLSALAKVMGKSVRENVIAPLSTRLDSATARITALTGELDRTKQRVSAQDRHIQTLERKFGDLNQKFLLLAETASRDRH